MSFDSSRNVGKIWNVSASACWRRDVASNVCPAVTMRSWSLRSSWVSAPNTTPVLRMSACVCCFWPSRTRSRSVPSSANAGSVPRASLRSWLWPRIAFAASCCQPWNAAPGPRVERVEDLVELDRPLHLRVGEHPAVGDRARGARMAGRELDERLAEQRLLAQDRAGVLRDRGVAGVDLDRRDRAVAVARVDRLRPHLADVHAGDADVRLEAELRGLGERDLELVALGLERHGAAEAEPEEQQQPEARQREQHHREDLADAGRRGRHLAVPADLLVEERRLEQEVQRRVVARQLAQDACTSRRA